MQSTFKQGAAKARKQISWRKTQRSVYRNFRYPDGSEKEECFPLRPAIKHDGITIREIPLENAGTSYECDIPAQIIGKRKQKRFKTKDEAIVFAEQAVIRRENKGLEGFKLQSDQQQDALKAFKTLADRGTLQEAAKFYIAHHFPKAGDISLIELQAKHEKHLANLNRRAHTLRENTSRLNDLNSHFKPNTLVKDITTDALSTYFQSNPQWSDHTRRSHYAVIRSFLNFAVEEKYLQTNPINAVKRPPKPKDNKPGILTIEQTSKLLDAIKSAENEAQQAIGPYVVLALFCGIRAEELDRLTWDLVDEEKQTVEIPEDIAKKHRFRYVDIPDNAVMWLRHFGLKATGPIRAKNHRKLVELSRDQAGIKKWPKNAMRHSFASYHFELHGDSKKTANELGHRGEDLLFSHYRSLTKKGSGSQYFSILPDKTESNITQIPASA